MVECDEDGRWETINVRVDDPEDDDFLLGFGGGKGGGVLKVTMLNVGRCARRF